MKVIAVDFDGTLCENAFPLIGRAKFGVIEKLLDEQDEGAKIILWTCRSGKNLQEAVEWCEKTGIVFDAINENIPEMIELYGTDPRKVGADEYWDDKAVRC